MGVLGDEGIDESFQSEPEDSDYESKSDSDSSVTRIDSPKKSKVFEMKL